MLCYFVVFTVRGCTFFVIVNKIDEAVLDRADVYTNPQTHRLRDLGKQLYLQQKTGSAVSQNVLAERTQPVAEVDSANQKDTKRRAAL